MIVSASEESAALLAASPSTEAAPSAYDEAHDEWKLFFENKGRLSELAKKGTPEANKARDQLLDDLAKSSLSSVNVFAKVVHSLVTKSAGGATSTAAAAAEAPAAVPARSFFARLFVCGASADNDPGLLKTLLIKGGSSSGLTWGVVTQQQVKKDLETSKQSFRLVPLSDAHPPQIASVPSYDDRTTWEIFDTEQALELAFQRFIPQWFHIPAAPAEDWGDYGKPTDAAAGWQDDAYFTEQRTFGVNPCAISMLTDAVKQEHFGDHLDLFADADAKYYACDFKVLVPFSQQLAAAHQGGSDKNSAYVPAPMCVFKYKDAKLAPIAIVLDQSKPKSAQQVVVNDGTNSVAWRYAKQTVRAADFNVHEIGAHLTLSHIVSEVACVITHDTLPKQHPIFQLLMPHFYLTLPLNDNARSNLVPKFMASCLTAFDTEQCFALAAKIYKDWSFESHYAPNDIKARGVEDLPPSVYPYTSTANATWKATHVYVKAVLDLCSRASSSFVHEDTAILEWIAQMQIHMPGFPKKVSSVDDLANALTMIIFTATHQHAAVNYFQKKYMAFYPAAVGFLAVPDLTMDVTKMDEASLLASTPKPATGRVQTAMVNMLSDPPEHDETLVHFEFGSKTSQHYVKWDDLAEVFKTYQAAVADALEPYENTYNEVNTKILSQSVLI